MLGGPIVVRLLPWTIPFLFAAFLSGAEHYGYVRSGKKIIPGATVTATSGDQKLVTTSDESGLYAFDLPGGSWIFQVEIFGFQSAKEERTLQGVASVLDFDLELKSQTQEAPTTTSEPAAGFQTIEVKVQAEEAPVEQQLAAGSAPAM